MPPALRLDSLQSLVERTLLNPILMLALFTALLTRRPPRSDYATLPGLLSIIGVLRQITLFLNERAENNGTYDKYDWNKELVVLTGGSRGIGAAIVEELRLHNVKVVIIDIREPVQTDDRTHFYRCDLSSAAEIRTTTNAIRAEHGDPTVLVNVAGTWNPTSLLDTSDEATSQLFAINVLAQFSLIKAFAPAMVKRNHGMIVTTSSAIAYGTSPPAMVDYAATKSALVSLHESVGAELALRYRAPAIRTILVVPGFTNTPLTAGLKRTSILWPAVEPADLAKKVVKQILSGRGGHVVLPKSLSWTDMMVRAWPAWLRKIRSGRPTIARSE